MNRESYKASKQSRKKEKKDHSLENSSRARPLSFQSLRPKVLNFEPSVLLYIHIHFLLVRTFKDLCPDLVLSLSADQNRLKHTI